MPAKPEFEEISPGVYALFAKGWSSNAYLLIGENKTHHALIDTGLHENAAVLEHALSALAPSIAPADISLILHTHGHADHISADFAFPNAEIAMHPADAEYVNAKDTHFTASSFFQDPYFPEITRMLSSEEKIKIGKSVLEVLHTPGHTAGSVCFLERKAKILFSGDTVFLGAVGRHDLVSGAANELRSSLEKLSALDFEILLSGHGNVLRGKQRENIENAIAMLG